MKTRRLFCSVCSKRAFLQERCTLVFLIQAKKFDDTISKISPLLLHHAQRANLDVRHPLWDFWNTWCPSNALYKVPRVFSRPIPLTPRTQLHDKLHVTAFETTERCCSSSKQISQTCSPQRDGQVALTRPHVAEIAQNMHQNAFFDTSSSGNHERRWRWRGARRPLKNFPSTSLLTEAVRHLGRSRNGPG